MVTPLFSLRIISEFVKNQLQAISQQERTEKARRPNKICKEKASVRIWMNISKIYFIRKKINRIYGGLRK